MLTNGLFSLNFEDNKDHKSNLSVLVKTVAKMVTGCLRMMKSCHICLCDQKVVLVGYEKYGTLSIYLFKSWLMSKYNVQIYPFIGGSTYAMVP